MALFGNRKKDRSAPSAEMDFRSASRKVRTRTFMDGAQSWPRDYRLMPWILLYSKLMIGCVVIQFALVAFLVLTRPKPDLYLSYPDGSVRCAPATASLDGKTQRLSRDYLENCQILEQKFGSGAGHGEATVKEPEKPEAPIQGPALPGVDPAVVPQGEDPSLPPPAQVSPASAGSVGSGDPAGAAGGGAP